MTAATGSRGLELGLAFVSVLAALFGLYIAYVFYYKKPRTAAAIAGRAPALYRLVENKFYIDEIYSTVIVGSVLMFSRLVLGLASKASSSTAPAQPQALPPQVSVRSSAAYNPATFARTPAGSPLGPQPFCSL